MSSDRLGIVENEVDIILRFETERSKAPLKDEAKGRPQRSSKVRRTGEDKYIFKAELVVRVRFVGFYDLLRMHSVDHVEACICRARISRTRIRPLSLMSSSF